MTKTPKEKEVEPRLRGGVLCSRGGDDESPTSTNLENDHGWIYNQRIFSLLV